MDSIIFDVDGTLWDSTGIVAEAWSDYLIHTEHMDTDVSSARLMGLFGQLLPDIARALFPKLSEAEEWVAAGNLFPEEVTVRREKTYGNSRFDLYVESEERKAFIEVKGVTLEENDIVRFPDAPTERGIKHLHELMKAASDGYEAYLLLVIQMKDVRYFEPNRETHPKFGETLKEAADAGVHILAYDCAITEDSMKICDPVPVKL